MKFKLGLIFQFIFFFNIYLFPQYTFFIKYKSEVPNSLISQMVKENRLSQGGNLLMQKGEYFVKHFARNLAISDVTLSRILRVDFSNNNLANQFINQLKNDPTVDYIQQSNIYKVDYIPNDSLTNQQWALQKIKAFDAWNITQGSDSIIVGIIDTGIDYLHPDLKNKIYINPGETGFDKNGKDKRTNGIDDDNNGFIDDYMGWNFVDTRSVTPDSSNMNYSSWNNNPMDENGHGTYIAGIVGAETDNGIGIAGVAPKVRLLNVRAFDANGYGQEDDVASAILYSVMMGAKVINMSFGDTQFSYVLRDVIRYAYSKGVVLVASSGNSGDDQPHYPSGYTEVISVGNSTEDDNVAPSSSYGSRLDMVAPGTDILTTSMGGGYSTVSGTSASAPFVSAAASLLLSIGNFTNDEVKQILKTSADDIGATGWDIYSGSGRLNLFNALNAAVPSIIKFISPLQDFATNKDSLNIYATVLSAYFSNYSLFLGVGINPQLWTPLIQNSQYQFQNKNIFNLNLKNLSDTTYCLRLLINFTNGKNSEERVNFSVERNPPVSIIENSGPILLGDKTTIIGSIYTDQPTVVKMYYRQLGTNFFNSISLDEFSNSSKTISNFHFGFIPVNQVQQNSQYEVYYEAVNLAGLKTDIMNQNKYLIYNTSNVISIINAAKLSSYSLPAGEIYENPVSLTSNDSNEIFLRPLSNPSTTYLYKYKNNSFILIDSINNRIVQSIGDYNNNGKKDLLCYYVYNGYIYEQSNQFSSALVLKFADTTEKFWPITAQDIDGDGITEILDVDSDSSISVWKVNNNLQLYDRKQLTDFSSIGSSVNLLDAPHAVIADINGTGKKAIWMADKKGNIFSYNIIGVDNYQKGSVISTNMLGFSAYLSAGNYTGDGNTYLAALLHSNSETENIAPYYRLIVFNFQNDSLNIILDKSFIDLPAASSSTFQSAENSLRFANIENQNYDDLVVFIYPYSYIFRYDSGKNTMIQYSNNVNSSTVFIGDLNRNGIPEVAFPNSSGINFYEFTSANSANTPYDLIGHSIDSSKVELNWQGIGYKYFIYRGSNSNNLALIDSTTLNWFIDSTVVNSINYFYSIKSYDPSKQISLSDMSSQVKIYSHQPAMATSAYCINNNSIIINFSNRINNKVGITNGIYADNLDFPNSIAAKNEYSYLLTFSSNFSPGIHKIFIHRLKDFYGSPITDDSVIFNVGVFDSSTSNFYISSYQIINPSKIEVVFNLPLDSVTAVNRNNFLFEPQNNISNILLNSANPNSIFIILDGKHPVGSVGINYKLKISNLLSSKLTGNLIINNNAGSYIIFQENSSNLSNVYVYPNPANIATGEDKITFANVSNRIKISIFTMSGKKISDFTANTQNGGVSYFLRDSFGNPLNSGVYIYRIVRLNEFNNEVEEKLGKFAVIK